MSGASMGIGRELCYQLAAAGANLIISARNEQALCCLLSELPRPEDHFILKLDLKNLPELDALRKQLFSRYDRVDYLINNAGELHFEAAGSANMAIQRSTMETNYFGNIALCKVLMPHWKTGGFGKVVVISSMAGLSSSYRISAYAASKHALHGFYESLHLESNGAPGVQLICPGTVYTPYPDEALDEMGRLRWKSQASNNPNSVWHCANTIIQGLDSNELIRLVGGKELRLLFYKKWLPGFLYDRYFFRKTKKQREQFKPVMGEFINFGFKMKSFKGKVAWITGASSGIGEETARQLAQAGAKLVLSARNTDALEELRASLNEADKHLVLALDLEHSEHFPELAKKVIDHFGRIDLLVNNGGLSQRSEAAKTSLDVDRRIMEINYFGNIALTKAVLPYMQQQNSGHIIVISSISGKFGFYLRSAYSASKHALHGFYESLLLEEAPHHIGVTLVCPGKINTPISTNALTGDGKKHGLMDHNQETGMPVDVCVKQMLKAVQKGKKEVLIGNREIKAVWIKRFFPKLFWKIITKQSAT